MSQQLVVDIEPRSHLQFGWGKFRPQYLQRFHNAKFLVTTLTLCAIVQSLLINSIIPISLSTLERRFQLSSVQMGIFASAYDFAVLFCLIPVTQYGERGHKGRWIANGMLIMALGSFIISMPHFLAPAYRVTGMSEEDGQTQMGLCLSENQDNSLSASYYENSSSSIRTVMASITNEQKDEDLAKEYMGDRASWFYFGLMLIGNCLHGVGSTPIWTLGVTYLDENVTQDESPMYLGIFLGCSLFGPVIGYIGGAAFLRIYGEWMTVDASTLSIGPEHPDWYGAWWMGFWLATFMGLAFAFLMYGFAHRLPTAPAENAVLDQTSKIQFSSDGAELWHGIKTVFNSTTYIFLCKVEILESILATGVVNFFPKLLESFFRFSPSFASAITGSTLVPAAVTGNIMGGWLTRKLGLHYPTMLLLSVLADVGTIILGACFLLYCPTGKFAGITEPYPLGAPLGHITNVCNSNCSCIQSTWTPMCDTETDTYYFSPCHAGCTNQSLHLNKRGSKLMIVLWNINFKEYHDCSCAQTVPSANISDSKSEPRFREGYCEKTCELAVPFLIIFGLYVGVAFMSAVPIQDSELRSVPYHQRSLAFGIRWIFIRIFGTIPGPIILGRYIDSVCLASRQTSDAPTFECVLYDNERLSKLIVLTGTPLKLLTILCLAIAWHYGRQRQSVVPITIEPAPKATKAHEHRLVKRSSLLPDSAPSTTETVMMREDPFVVKRPVKEVDHLKEPTQTVVVSEEIESPQQTTRKQSRHHLEAGSSHDSQDPATQLNSTQTTVMMNEESVIPREGHTGMGHTQDEHELNDLMDGKNIATSNQAHKTRKQVAPQDHHDQSMKTPEHDTFNQGINVNNDQMETENNIGVDNTEVAAAADALAGDLDENGVRYPPPSYEEVEEAMAAAGSAVPKLPKIV